MYLWAPMERSKREAAAKHDKKKLIAEVEELKDVVKKKDEEVKKAQEESRRQVDEAEEKELEREAARAMERGTWEGEILARQMEVQREEREFEEERKKWADLQRIDVQGQLWQVRQRAMDTAMVVEEGREQWYRKVDAWCEGWMEGKEMREEEERRMRS